MAEISMDEVRAIGKTGNSFLAVVDGNYSPRSGEKLIEVKGGHILIKKPQALKEYYDLYKAFKNWDLEKYMKSLYEFILSAIKSGRTSDPKRMDFIYKYAVDSSISPVVTLMKKKVNEYNKKRLKNGQKIYDDSMLTKEYFCEKFKKMWNKELFRHTIDCYIKEALKEELWLEEDMIAYFLQGEIPAIYDTYAVCMKEFEYDIFTVENCSRFPVTDKNRCLFNKLLRIDRESLSDSEKLDLYFAMICVNPFYENGWIFLDMSELLGDSNHKIREFAENFYPDMSLMWMSLIIDKIDSDDDLNEEMEQALHNIDDGTEQLKLLKNKIYGYMENADVLNAYKGTLRKSTLLSDIDKAINIVERGEARIQEAAKQAAAKKEEEERQRIENAEYEKKLQGYYEEAQETSKYKPKNKYVAMTLLVLLGLFGAHKFYEGRIALGILYFFTCGLFCIGLICDFVVLFEMPETYIPGQKFGK